MAPVGSAGYLDASSGGIVLDRSRLLPWLFLRLGLFGAIILMPRCGNAVTLAWVRGIGTNGDAAATLTDINLHNFKNGIAATMSKIYLVRMKDCFV